MEHTVPEYAIHDDKNIKGFFGEYRYLSNYHKCEVYFDGLKYGSTEAAYQSAKTHDMTIRELFSMMGPGTSRKEGQLLQLVPEWHEKVKYEAMSVIVFDKFYRHRDLREMLLSTGDKYLEETNHWNDVYWGVCNGVGQNNLGKVLMKVRDYWK